MRIEYSVNNLSTRYTFNVTYDYNNSDVRYYSDDVTLNNGDVVTFYATNIDLDSVEFAWGTTDFIANGTSIHVVNIESNSKYIIEFFDTKYDAEENKLMVGFHYNGSGDKPKS